MSTIFFGTKQLAEIANFAADGSLEDLHEMAAHLAAYSEANAVTFMTAYPAHRPFVVGVSAADIEAQARILSPVLLKVLTHAGLLRYNAELDAPTEARVATVIDRVLVVVGNGGRS